MVDIKKNVYITYIETIKKGYTEMQRFMGTDNPVYDVYGDKRCNKIINDARCALEQITADMLKDYSQEIRRVGNPDLSNICHEFLNSDLNIGLQQVAEPLRPEWWMLANRLKQCLRSLQKLKIIGDIVLEEQDEEMKSIVQKCFHVVLLPFLKSEIAALNKAKQKMVVANLMYESCIFQTGKRPSTFTGFARMFCRWLGMDEPKDLTPGKYRPDENQAIKSKFYFLSFSADGLKKHQKTLKD